MPPAQRQRAATSQDHLCRLLNPDDARRLRDALARVPADARRAAVADALWAARWQATVFDATTRVNVRARQKLSRASKSLPTRARQAWRGLLAAIAFHAAMGVLDEHWRAYCAAAEALWRDPLLTLDREGARRRTRRIAGAVVARIGPKAHPPSGPRGGRPARFSLRRVRHALGQLGIRGEVREELLAAAGLTTDEETSTKKS